MTHEAEAAGRIPLAELIGILACPACRAPVAERPPEPGLACGGCGATYPIVEGVPLMLTADSRALLQAGEEPDGTAARPRRWWSVWFGRFVEATSPAGPSYDPHQTTRIRRMLDELGAGGRTLDLGAGGRAWGPRVIPMDIDRFPGVALVGDGHRLPFADGVLDGVICTGVLEHVDDAEAMTAEIFRVLRPAGLLYVAVPFLQGYHPASGTHQDFRRLTHIGLRRLLRAFREREFGIAGGPSSALAWVLREYLALLLVGRGRLYAVTYLVSGWLTWWLKYLDALLIRRAAAHRIACGFYFFGAKPEGPA